MRIACHLGLRKTASTSIQEMLRQNAALLGEDVQVLARDEELEPWRGHVYRYMRARPPGIAKAFAAMLYGIRQEADLLAQRLEERNPKTVILSDENLFAARAFAHGETLFDWGRAVVPIIDKAFEGHDVRYILYLRPRYDWLKSCYSEAVRNHRETATFKQWRVAMPENLSLETGATRLAAKTDNPFRIVDLHEELASGRGLGAAILDEAGIARKVRARLTPAPHVNESPPDSAVAFMREVNRLKLPTDHHLAIKRVVDRMPQMFNPN